MVAFSQESTILFKLVSHIVSKWSAEIMKVYDLGIVWGNSNRFLLYAWKPIIKTAWCEAQKGKSQTKNELEKI